MEQTDAEAERHVFCFFLFFSRTFSKTVENFTQTSVHYPYVHVIFEHRASLRDSSTFALENCDCPCRPQTSAFGSQTLDTAHHQGAPLTLLVPKLSTKAHSFRHLCHLYTRHSCIPSYVGPLSKLRLFATVFSIELRQSVSSTKVSILVLGVVKGITVQD